MKLKLLQVNYIKYIFIHSEGFKSWQKNLIYTIKTLCMVQLTNVLKTFVYDRLEVLIHGRDM